MGGWAGEGRTGQGRGSLPGQAVVELPAGLPSFMPNLSSLPLSCTLATKTTVRAAPATTPENRPGPEKSVVRPQEVGLTRCSAAASPRSPELTGKKSVSLRTLRRERGKSGVGSRGREVCGLRRKMFIGAHLQTHEQGRKSLVLLRERTCPLQIFSSHWFLSNASQATQVQTWP